MLTQLPAPNLLFPLQLVDNAIIMMRQVSMLCKTG
jgi:hypothetical protein